MHHAVSGTLRYSAAMWLLLAQLLGAPAWAASPTGATLVSSAPDATGIHDVIRQQLDAFQRDDARGAWQHVAPNLRAKFGDPDTFLEMVRVGYPTVYRHRTMHFGEQVSLDTGETGQWIELEGVDGGRARALYLLERQADGAWKTTGCLLFAAEPSSPAV